MMKWNYYCIFCGGFGIFLFLYGFFLSSSYTNRSSLSSNVQNIYNTEHNPRREVTSTHSLVNKVVMVVIDALRYDFIAGEHVTKDMPYVSSQLNQSKGCLFPCRVHLPTVTMPRIKAMTVGSVSNFVDVALNLGSSEVYQDNILSQAVKMKKNIVFYGDDTWIRLFPKVFSRYEGTTSFFVSDFIEVDNNVTRNVLQEIKQEDWDMMILHYLGLDHIGHLEGPFSSKISWKLNEMDNIIEIIHRQLENWEQEKNVNYMLIICGDHGMKDTGGHGGSTLGEVLVPFLVFGNSCNTTISEIFQVDIAVTLSTLMGLPIPQENVGKLIYGLMDNLPLSVQLDAYYHNVMQLIKNYNNVIKENSELGIAETEVYLQATKSQRESDIQHAIRLYKELLTQLSAKLIDSLTRFDTLCLYLAIIILFQASYLPCISQSKKSPNLKIIIFVTLALTFTLRQTCVVNSNSSLLCSNHPFTIIFTAFVSCVISFNLIFLIASAKSFVEYSKTIFKTLRADKILLFMIACSIMQIISTISTSFIEEEHMTWYYFWTTWLIVSLLRTKIKKEGISLFISLIINRIVRKINQTGDQWASLPDISDWLIESQHKTYLSLVFGFGLIGMFFCMNHFDSKKRRKFNRLWHFLSILNKCFTISCLILIFVYRLAVKDVFFYDFSRFLSDKGMAEFEIFLYVFLVTAFVKCICIYFNGVNSTNDGTPIIKDVLKAITDLWILITCMLLRPTNVILPSSLIFSSSVVCKVLQKQTNEIIKLILIHHWLARVYFFYQGNSNSLASIDIASGYIGQTSYNSWIVGSLIICSTYSMPILAYLLMIRRYVAFIFRHNRRPNWNITKSSILISINIWLTLETFDMFFYMVIIMNFRYHLFIWSVFSPKLLYLSANYLLLYPVLITIQWFFDKYSGTIKL